MDVYLESATAKRTPERWAIFIRQDGRATKEIDRAEWDRLHPGVEPVIAKVGGESRELYSRNITHSVATEDADNIKALDRLLGDSGCFGGDFGSIVEIAIDSLLPEDEE